MFPKVLIQATLDLKVKILLPMHWGNNKITLHDCHEPIIEVVKDAK